MRHESSQEMRAGTLMSRRPELVSANERRTRNITSAQRAAVIVALLGEGAARPIASKMDDAALSKVAAALESISYLSRDDVIEIVIDFLQQLRGAKGSLSGGPARAREVLSSIVDSGRLSALFGDDAGGFGDAGGFMEMDWQSIGQGEDNAGDGDTWLRLSQREPQKIAEYLNRLSPNLIAMILSKLDAAVASSVLCFINEEKLSPILSKMIEPPKADPEIDAVISRMVDMEFLNLPQAVAGGDDGHLETIGEMLSLIPNEKRENLLGVLQTKYESKMPIIQRGLFTIVSLPDILPRVAVPVVMKEVDPDLMMKVLTTFKNDYPAVLEYILGNISSRMADQIREDLKGAPSIPDAEAETLHRDFLTQLMDMRRKGLITITKPS